MTPRSLVTLALSLVTAMAASSAHAVIIVVDDASDTVHSCAGTGIGPCSLRDAILFANVNSGSDTINFNIAGGGAHTITPLGALPAIAETVTIDGYTQPGATANTLAIGNDANLLIQLNGGSAGPASGLVVGNAPNTLIKGLVISNFTQAGIQLAPTSDTLFITIQGNFIGTTPTGTVGFGNGGGGIDISSVHAINSQIGGNPAAARNLISGNSQNGISLTGPNTQVQGNYIGTNASGTAALPNGGSGVDIISNNNLIGGNPAFGQRNVISGNGQHGVSLLGTTSNLTQIIGNFIGTDATGTLKLGNTLDGVFTNAPQTQLTPGANVIGGNLRRGITISGSADGTALAAQIIGTDLGKTINLGNGSLPTDAGIDISGSAAVTISNPTIAFNAGPGIRISNNPVSAVIVTNGSFFSNGGRAIDMTDGPPPVNDLCDGDSGNNDLMNYPVVDAARVNGSIMQIDFTFNGVPGVTHTIEFFSSPACDPSGFGEGKTRLGQTSAVPGPSPGCSTSATNLNFTIPTGTAGQNVITAYARGGTGKTSEFSQCVVATGAAPPVLQSAVSRLVQGASGTFDVPLSLVTPPAINHNPATEPRQVAAKTIVFTYDKPISSAVAAITEGTATAAAPTFSGNDVVVGLTGVTDIQYVTIGLSNVASTDGGTGGSGSVRVGFLAGDVNQTRAVTISDLVLVNNQQLMPLTASNFLMDVNASGSVTVSDKVIVNQKLLHALPTP